MIDLICSNCNSNLELNKMIRYSDQFQIIVQPCTCIQSELVDLKQLQSDLDEECFVICESELESMVEENNSLLLYNEMKEDLDEAYKTADFYRTKTKNIGIKLSKLKKKLYKKYKEIFMYKEQIRSIKNSNAKTIKKLNDKIAKCQMEEDRTKVENKMLLAKIEKLSFQVKELIAITQKDNYRRSIEI